MIAAAASAVGVAEVVSVADWVESVVVSEVVLVVERVAVPVSINITLVYWSILIMMYSSG